MLQWWANELGVGVNVGDLLQLESSKRAMFRNFSMPMAAATIQKGGTLTQEEQGLVEAYDGGRLERRLQNLLSQKTPPYRGVAASVIDLQRCRRWW